MAQLGLLNRVSRFANTREEIFKLRCCRSASQKCWLQHASAPARFLRRCQRFGGSSAAPSVTRNRGAPIRLASFLYFPERHPFPAFMHVFDLPF